MMESILPNASSAPYTFTQDLLTRHVLRPAYLPLTTIFRQPPQRVYLPSPVPDTVFLKTSSIRYCRSISASKLPDWGNKKRRGNFSHGVFVCCKNPAQSITLQAFSKVLCSSISCSIGNGLSISLRMILAKSTSCLEYLLASGSHSMV